MEGPRETVWTSMSPKDVLAVLMEDYRHQVLNDPEADHDVILTFDSTIAEWRSARDLLPWRPLGLAMNERFGVEIKESRWHEILEPAKVRTLRVPNIMKLRSAK